MNNSDIKTYIDYKDLISKLKSLKKDEIEIIYCNITLYTIYMFDNGIISNIGKTILRQLNYDKSNIEIIIGNSEKTLSYHKVIWISVGFIPTFTFTEEHIYYCFSKQSVVSILEKVKEKEFNTIIQTFEEKYDQYVKKIIDL